jgi:hypothetical protein
MRKLPLPLPIDIPVSALVCGYHLCNDTRHLRDLNEYCVSIINSCTIAAEQCIPVTCKIGEKRIPGWNSYVQPHREKAMFWHKI